ncbi:hypothetical protein AAFC00_001007 [Neodothiora populina]|uniref:Tyrosine--tRNA ligase n=1 Tax=Neodothiora populina TaxID=2781224 RepID=A0ABR3PMI3_9PEZI
MASSTPQTPQEQFDLICDNLQEVLNPEIIKHVLEVEKRPLEVYWGTATTGRPHCGYFVPCLKIAQFLQAGCKVKVLLADIHGFLDNLKAPIELVEYRAVYYRFVITELLKAAGAPIEKLEFVLGSSYQLSKEYTMDRFRLESVTTMHDAKKAGAEVVKQVDNATLSSLIYPVMQALDEEYLKVDAQFGGVDQRKIFALAKDCLPKIGYKERAHLMNAMVPGLAGGKMSSSDPDSKIDLLDEPAVVQKKLKKAFAMPKVVEDNGVLSFVEYVLLPASALKYGAQKFVVERREGGPLVYTDIKTMQDDYRADVLTPQLLKSAVTPALIDLLAPIQAAFKASEEWQAIEKQAYPPPPEKKKKEKKDKGSRHPGAAAKQQQVEAKPDGSVKGQDSAEVSVGKSVDEALEKLELEKKAVA